MRTKISSRDWYYLHAPQEREEIAQKLDISEHHLRKVMVRDANPGRYLALKLEANTPYDRHYWRPDIFGTADQQEEVAA